MSELYHDRYRKTVTASAPGDSIEYSHQCLPAAVGDVLLSASGHVRTWNSTTAQYTHFPISIEVVDTPTYGDGNVAYAYYKWDDGMGGADVAGTATLTCIFAKAVQL